MVQTDGQLQLVAVGARPPAERLWACLREEDVWVQADAIHHVEVGSQLSGQLLVQQVVAVAVVGDRRLVSTLLRTNLEVRV